MLVKMLRCLMAGLLSLLFIASRADAQDNATAASAATIQLLAADTLQTGQYYDVTIQLDTVPEAWLASIEIGYDPDMLYIEGTQSRQPPITPGTFFGTENTTIVRNLTTNNQLNYVISLVAPAEIVAGSGTLGTFRVYPLQAGTTELSFITAELGTVTFTQVGDQRVGSDPRAVPVTTTDLQLTITGDTVTPIPEATATPAPTETPVAVAIVSSPDSPALNSEATLDPNAAFAVETPTPAVPTETDNQRQLITITLGLFIVAAFIGGILLTMWLNQRRK
jgi:hypothetical protein